MRVVIDTNLFVSALINQNSRQRLNLVLEKMAIQILSDDALMAEVYEVINRPKFKKYVSQFEIDEFYKLIQERTSRIETHSIVLVSPDPKDDFLLVICLDGDADYLLIKAFDKDKLIGGAKINYDNLAVYQVVNGKLENLIAQNERLVNTNPLSETINNIYDQYAALD